MKGFRWIKFFPGDWTADTRALTLAAKGAWIDILAALHDAPNRGELTLSVSAWARVLGATESEAGQVISELRTLGIADIELLCNANVTVRSRRMIREEKSREDVRERVNRHREKDGAPHPDENGKEGELALCNGNVTQMKRTEARSQKPEAKNKDTQRGVDFAKIVAEYHDLCPSLPRVSKLTDGRKKNLARRWEEAGENPLAWFRSLFARVEASDFLTARSGDWNADFDWILKPENTVKICEDRYLNRTRSAADPYREAK